MEQSFIRELHFRHKVFLSFAVKCSVDSDLIQAIWVNLRWLWIPSRGSTFNF